MNDEHGMPVPGEVLTKADFVFCQHAFNYIIPCREIVRRLAEPDNLSLGETESVIRDATILWSKMLKGAGDDDSR